MSDITLSKAVRSNLLNLQNTAELMAKTQDRLATGKKVNSALDNPTNFFTASSLNSRAGDLGRLLDSVGNATQTIEAANNGLTAITKLVETAQATARQALQTTGQVTQNKIVGSTSATYAPKALTKVEGDNTGLGALAADAPASINFGAIAEDLVNIADIATGDLDTNDTDGLGLLSDAGADGPGLVDGDSISLTINDVEYTLNFDAATSAGGVRAGDATNGYTLSLGVDQTLASLQASFSTLLAGSGATVAGTDGFTFSFDNTVDTAVLADGLGTGATLTKLGLNAVGTDRTATVGDTGDRLLARNASFEGELAAREGQTLNISKDGAVLATLTFGTGDGEISTKDDLVTRLNNLTGITATNPGGGGAVTVKVTSPTDAKSELTLTASSVEINNLLAFDVAADDGTVDLDTQNGLITTSKATNLINQGAVAGGDSIDIKVANFNKLEIVFGTGANQVSTLAELNSKLQELSGGAASADSNGEINITSDKGGDTITLGGTTTALASFGLAAGETNNILTTDTGIAEGDTMSIQVGTNTLLELKFGSGENEISTHEELVNALDNLAGGTATIDPDTGAITINATNGADQITVTSADNTAAAKPAVATAFGLTHDTVPVDPQIVDSEQRTSLEKQYNSLLSQISDLVKDAGYNGVNLLNGNDLSVIFNEDGSSTLNLTGVTFDSAGLGLSSLSNGMFQADANIHATLDSLDTAASTLRSQASTFGSNLSVVESRQDFTKRMINTLETGAANLTLADTNEEAANLLALQTRQQLSSTALSLASEADQNVLRLF